MLAGHASPTLRALHDGSPHVFKHTYLSRLADMDANPLDIMIAGDHKDIQTSLRYVHRARRNTKALARQAHQNLPKAARR